MTDLRMAEIAEKAITFLADNFLLESFEEDFDIDFTEEEREYFEIESESEEEEL